MDEEGKLTPRAKAWNRAIRAQFASRPAGSAAVEELAAVGNSKIY